MANRRARFGGAAQRIELGEGRRRAFEIGRGEIEIGPDQPACLDLPPDTEIAVRVDRAGGARGGDAAGEIERREGDRRLDDRERAVARGGAVHMLVHADEARNGGAPAPVDPGDAAGKRDRPVRPDRGDAATLDEDRLVRPGRGAGAVDDEDMLDRDQRGAHAHEIGLRPRLRRGAAGQ